MTDPILAAGSEPSSRLVPILLFDGDCGGCTTAAEWAARRLPAHPPIASWQSVEIAAYGLTPDDCSAAVQWVDHDGIAHAGAAGIARLLCASGGAWRWWGTAMRNPPGSWISRAAYRVVAHHRHRLPGGTPACAADPAA